jgi:hypothetical protein
VTQGKLLNLSYRLAMHLISEHGDVEAVGRTESENVRAHASRHVIRGETPVPAHHYSQLSYDEERVERALESAESESSATP